MGHTGLVVLQDHHAEGWAMQGLPLLTRRCRVRFRRYYSYSGKLCSKCSSSDQGSSCGAVWSVATRTLSKTAAKGSARVPQFRPRCRCC